MQLTVNGQERQVDDDTTIADIVGARGRGVAVAVNQEVVPRSGWQQAALQEGDHVEIVEVHQGG